MLLNIRDIVLLILMTLVHKCFSQSYLPLYPCYSVHKIQPTNPANSVYYYRFLGSLVIPSDGTGIDCMFTIEGPPGSILQLQLLDVVLQKTGYVSTSQDDNCSLGLIQIYNLTTNGALVQAQKVCGSFMAGPKIISDTNVAVITTTTSQGQFDLLVTLLRENANLTFRSDAIQGMDKTRVIILGYENEDFNEDYSEMHIQQQAPLMFIQEELEHPIKNSTTSKNKTKLPNNQSKKNENIITVATEEVEGDNSEQQDDLLNYIEYDYDYEPEQQKHASQEELSQNEEEKLPLEKLFDLRGNSKYAKPNQAKTKITNNRQKQQKHFVQKSRHQSETMTGNFAIRSPNNATRMKTKHNN